VIHPHQAGIKKMMLCAGLQGRRRIFSFCRERFRSAALLPIVPEWQLLRVEKERLSDEGSLGEICHFS
jgi:hypothetical protein